MKILAIASSFRKNGNSETLLNTAFAGIRGRTIAIKKIALSDLHIHPCNGCLLCLETGKCVIKDDMQDLYKELSLANIILVASPIYFMGLPCQLKCVIDRCQALWAKEHSQKKRHPKNRKETRRIGAAILVSASSGVKTMFTGSVSTLRAWFNTLGVGYKGVFIAEGLEEKTAAVKNRKLLKKAQEFGKRLGG